MLRCVPKACSLLSVLGLLVACAGPVAQEPLVLAKHELLHAPEIGRITGLAWREADRTLVVSGKRGVRVFDLQGREVARVGFTRPSGDCASFSHIEPFDLDGDGGLEYVARGGGWQPVGVLDGEGGVRWVLESESAPNWMTPAHLDADGAIDFVVGFNGGGGIWRLDAEGSPVWQMDDGNVWRVEIVDVEPDGAPEILHTNAHGIFTVRDVEGRVLDRFHTGAYAADFAVLDPTTAIHHAGERYLVFDLRGEILRELPAAFPGSVSEFQARALRLDGHDGRSIAVLESQASTPVSVLQVFGADGERIHEELLEEACEALGWLPAGEGGDLLVGCEERVWRYRVGGAGASTRSAAEFAAPGGLFGSLRPGDSREDVQRRMDLMELASCFHDECQVYSEDEKLRVVPVFEDEALSWVLVAGSAWIEASDEARIHRVLDALIARARLEYGEPVETLPLPALTEVTATAVTHRWRTDWGYAEAGLRTRVEDEREFIPALIAVPASPDADGAEASSPPASPAD